MRDGWRLWLDWQRAVAPNNTPEIAALDADAGRLPAYIRAIALVAGVVNGYRPIGRVRRRRC
jgi:hypothetical protein